MKITKDENFPNDLEIFVTTSPHGLAIINKKRHYELFDVPAFGITCDLGSDEWFVYADDSIHKIYDKRIVDTIALPKLYFKRVHQIDFIDDIMYVTVTKKTPIIDLLDKNRGFESIKRIELHKHRRGHINSVFRFENKLYFMAHNMTRKTNKKSSILVMNKKHNIIETKKNIGSSCHNYYTDGNDEFWCNSNAGALVKNGKTCVQFEKDDFTRGLSISNKYIIVGTTKLQSNRALRSNADGEVHIFDRSLNKVSTVTIKKAQVRDIRQSSHLDLTLSNAAKEQVKC